MKITDFFAKLPEPIITERLILRAPLIKDAKDLAHLLNNKNIHKMLARAPYPYYKSDAIEFINEIVRTKVEHGYAITDKNDVFIGIISLHITDAGEAEIGYWLGEPFWGKGLMSEAVKALIDAALKTGICPPMVSRAITINKGSIKVLKNCGYKITDTHIDDCGQHKGVMVTHLRLEI